MARSFGDFFTIAAHQNTSHVWAELKSHSDRWEDATLWVAVSIARSRFGNSSTYFNAWNNRRLGGPRHTAEQYDVLAAHIASEAIGTPDNPANATHLRGLVAEFIWYEVVSLGETPVGMDIVRVEEPSWSPTDSGGDGLVVYTWNDTLTFCLWESKAHEGNASSVRDVVNGACRQIDKKAIRYLARMSKIGQEYLDDDLKHFYGRLAEMWRTSSQEAGGGVSVTTMSQATSDSFQNFDSYWSFTQHHQRQGLVIVIGDFPGFADRVREHLWSGL